MAALAFRSRGGDYASMPRAAARPTLPAQTTSARGWILALLAIVLIAHGPAIFHEFVNWDDGSLVLQNPVLNPVSWANLGKIWSGPVEQLYTPLAYTLWSITRLAATLQTPDAQGVSLNPMVFHAVNVLLHVGSVLVMFDLLRALARAPRLLHVGATPRTVPQALADAQSAALPRHEDNDRRVVLAAFFGAAVFAVHPLNVEAVAWISGMNNVLAGLFSLATIDAYLHAATGGGRRTYWLSVVFFLLALLSKPTAIVTPMIVLLIDWLLLIRPWRVIGRWIVPFALLAVPFVIVGGKSQPAVEIYHPPLLGRLLVVGDTIGFYLTKLVVPLHLTIDYGRSPERVLWLHWWPATLALTVASFALVAWCWPRSRVPAAVLGIFIAGISIVSGITPFNFQAYSTVTDRYLYLSMLAPAVAVTLATLRGSIKVVSSVAGAAVVVLLVMSVMQARIWADGDVLATTCVQRNPTSLVGVSILGYNAEAHGDHAAQEYWFRRGLSFYPDDNTLTYNLANLLLADRPDQAIVYYNRAFNNGYHEYRLINNWGVALLKVGEAQQAINAFKVVIGSNPYYLKARTNIVRAYIQNRQFDQADLACRTLLQIHPGDEFATDTLSKLAQFRATAATGYTATAPAAVPDDFR